MQLARGPKGERITLTHDSCNRVIERIVERKGFRLKRWRYEWDAKDRLIACTTPEDERWTYGYDPFGRRVFKINATAARAAAVSSGRVLPGDEAKGAFYEDEGNSRHAVKGGEPIRVGSAYGWDGDTLAEEAPLCSDGVTEWEKAVRWHYEPNTFRPLARENADGTLLYIVTDHLCTPREMFSEDGNLVWAAEYRTWGSIRRLWRAEAGYDNAPASSSGPGSIGSCGGGRGASSAGRSDRHG